MTYQTINKYTDYFNTKTYTGNSGTLNVTGIGHQPDFVWIKDRSSNGDDHAMYDAVRGVNKRIRSNQNDAESTETAALTSFDSDGFTVGTAGSSNGNGDSFVSWNWKANGSGSANTDGSINSTVSVNQTAGFSIVKWTGTGSAGTVGHGLGAVPQMIIIKNLDSAEAWPVYHHGIAADAETDRLYLNLNNAASDSASHWNDTAPTSTLINLGTSSESNKSSSPMIAYCFAEKTGYSRIGFYNGSNVSDGPFVYTGGKPKFIMLKNVGHTKDWNIWDVERDTYNPLEKKLAPSTSNVDATDLALDFLSNGFKLRQNGSNFNDSYRYIYYVVCQPLVGTNGVPCVAE